MKLLLTKGHFAIVDADLFDYLSQWKWMVKKSRNLFYGGRKVRVENGFTKTMMLHRQIMGLALDDKRRVDHIDGNGLNCTKANMRVCSQGENARNRHVSLGSCKYKGVHWDKDAGKFRSVIMKEGKRFHIGRFDCEHEAAARYNEAAKELHGEFAALNQISFELNEGAGHVVISSIQT